MPKDHVLVRGGEFSGYWVEHTVCIMVERGVHLYPYGYIYIFVYVYVMPRHCLF